MPLGARPTPNSVYPAPGRGRAESLQEGETMGKGSHALYIHQTCGAEAPAFMPGEEAPPCLFIELISVNIGP